MNNLNSILMEGNLTKDPEKLNGDDKNTCCLITIATNRYYKHDDNYEQEVSYFDIKAFGNLADVCLQHLKKGRGIRVIGRLKQERWVDKLYRNKSRVLIIAENIEFKPVYKGEKPETEK